MNILEKEALEHILKAGFVCQRQDIVKLSMGLKELIKQLEQHGYLEVSDMKACLKIRMALAEYVEVIR